VAQLRRAVEEARPGQLIHLLGTGNPVSLAVLAAAGADSFDGLEWCRVVADHSTGHLHHPQHYDFFAYQDQVATLRIVQFEQNELSYIGKLALHNLDYFHEWIVRVRKALENPADMKHFLQSSLPKGAYVELAQAVPEVFT
jgi:queuine/archaeosine tRNA-ribosyltransferase